MRTDEEFFALHRELGARRSFNWQIRWEGVRAASVSVQFRRGHWQQPFLIGCVFPNLNRGGGFHASQMIFAKPSPALTNWKLLHSLRYPAFPFWSTGLQVGGKLTSRR